MTKIRINDGIVIDYSEDGWDEFKKWIDGTYGDLAYTWADEGKAYEIVAIDGKIYRKCSINKADATEFEAGYKTNAPTEVKTSDGKAIVAAWPTEGTRKTIVTSNWSDKTTWYHDSTAVNHEVLTATVSGTTYQASNGTIIDTRHGKITGEDTILTSGGESLLVTASGTVSGTTNLYTEADPHTGAGDYTVNYNTGELTFSPTLAVDTEVKFSYHTPASSSFVFGPSPGKLLWIKDVEVQFSTDLVITDSVKFEAYGYVDVFAPQYLQANGGPYPPGTKIPLSSTVYKTMMDYVNEANGSLPVMVKLGGEDWRGMASDVVIFPWNYQAMTKLSSAAGMEIRISLEHDTPFEGSVATVTFYCLSENEN